ncbi:MAG: gluconolaconase [Pyrinomonadaceae bacterium]
MNKAGRIKSVFPQYAIPGGQIAVECEGFDVDHDGGFGCYIGGERCRLVGASSKRLLAIVPDGVATESTQLHLESRGEQSESAPVTIGRMIAEDMHIVANPAVDPNDDSIVVTRSGSRGQDLQATLYRIEPDGYVDELPVQIMNPTGLAFDSHGQLFATNRSDGVVCRIDRGEDAFEFAAGLGIATGIAFDREGLMYVGDRSGTIYRVLEFGSIETFAVLEPSVSAYHLAFGPDDRLYVSAPGLASHDSVFAIDREGVVERYFRGFGRPQGLAFDTDGNLYVVGCYKGRHGIVRIDAEGKTAETVLAGTGIVGLCFTRKGEMIVATNSNVYSVPSDISGTLLA